jgi:hypothetical protein
LLFDGSRMFKTTVYDKRNPIQLGQVHQNSNIRRVISPMQRFQEKATP